ncbi:hypothetical protein AL036_17990 [Salipiger aestuarii]|nr:hypothetical protein AL036_17990 [Salipiger aestuarii]
MRIPLNGDCMQAEELHRQTRAFRVLLQAFGHPARLHRLEGDAVTAVISGLLDPGTTVAIHDSSLRADVLATGAVISEQAEWFFADQDLADLSSIPTGTRDMPERGATVVLPVTSLSATQGTLHLWARGAGIPSVRNLFVTGLSRGVIRDHIALRAEYPRGVDLLLCAGPVIAALPRHLRLEMP